MIKEQRKTAGNNKKIVLYRKKVPKICYTYCMDSIISHKSALEYWRLHGKAKTNNFVGQRRKSLPVSIPKSVSIREGAHLGLSYPINLMIGCQKAKRKSRIVRARVYNGPIPYGSFVGISDGLSTSTPPFCFFQMAGDLPLVKLIELGFELCGSYSLASGIRYSKAPDLGKGNERKIAPEGEQEDTIEVIDKNLYGRQQLTNTKALKKFVAYMKGVNGYKKAYRALRYIADGSASPMETVLIMLLTLPCKLGGYGLPAPELNRRVEIGNTAKRRSGKTYYKCDLFWPKANLTVEYDSDFYRTGANRIASHSEKRFNLTALGITVITVTSRQIRNIYEFDKIAELIAGRLRKRLRYEPMQFTRARRELRDLLL